MVMVSERWFLQTAVELMYSTFGTCYSQLSLSRSTGDVERESTPSPSQGSDHTGGLEAKNDFSLLSSVFVALPDIIKKPRAEP